MATNGNYPMKPPARQTTSTPPLTGTLKGEAYPMVNINGNRYAKVHQRVESAHKNGGYSVVSCEYKEIFDTKVCEVWIELPNGQRFPGTAEIDFTKKNPLAAGQTRAIGRALAFAGHVIETAIASEEEMEGVLEGQGARVVESEPQALPAPKVPQIALDCTELAKDLKMSEKEFKALAYSYTFENKTNWQNVKSALETAKAEKSLPEAG